MSKQMDQTALAELRTLLAAERTFLAWVRTGLSVIAGGLAVVKFLPFDNPDHEWVARLSGQALVVWGCATLIIGFINYRNSASRLPKDDVPQTSMLVFIVLTTVLLVIGALVFWLTL